MKKDSKGGQDKKEDKLYQEKISLLKSKYEKNPVLEENSPKGLKFFLSPFFLISFSLLLIVVIFGVLFIFPSEKVTPFSNCGDGTFSDYCSLNKPYFCSNKTLVQNATLCGCSESFRFTNENCISSYDSLVEEKYFYYNLYGENGTIYFKYRPKILDYLVTLPRYQIYSGNEIPRRDDFALKKIDDPLQKEFLMPLVAEIQNLHPDSKDMQAKVAVSLVQNIPYNESQFASFFGNEVRVSRYPYQVLGENQGECEGKSELLAFILREMNFGVVLFYYPNENHEAVGIKCPVDVSYLGTGYCFVETTISSPISFSEGRFLIGEEIGRLSSEPEIIFISDGISLSENLEDYRDSITLSKLIGLIEENGGLNPLQKVKMDELREKYNLDY